MEDMEFTVKYILDDGSDAYGYDSNYNITDGILYYGAEEITRDTDDLMNVIENIIEYNHNTVIDIIDDNDEVIYHNEEFNNEDDLEELEESFKRYNETLKKALGE